MNILCSICQELVNHDDGQMYSTRCGHIFHYSCLLNWVQRRESCPYCSKRVSEECIIRLYPSLSNEDPALNQLQLCLDETTANLERQKKLCREKDEKITKVAAELRTANSNHTEHTEEYKRKLNNLTEENKTLKRNIQSSNCLTEIAAAALKEKRKYMEAQDEEMKALRKDNDELKHKMDSLNRELRNLKDEKVDLTRTMRKQEVDNVKQFEALERSKTCPQCRETVTAPNKEITTTEESSSGPSDFRKHLNRMAVLCNEQQVDLERLQKFNREQRKLKSEKEELAHTIRLQEVNQVEQFGVLQSKLSSLKAQLANQDSTIAELNAKIGSEELDHKTVAFTTWLMEKYEALQISMQTLKESKTCPQCRETATAPNEGTTTEESSSGPSDLRTNMSLLEALCKEQEDSLERLSSTVGKFNQYVDQPSAEPEDLQTDKETTGQNTAVLRGTDNTLVLGVTINTSMLGGANNTSVPGGTVKTFVFGNTENTSVLEGTEENTAPPSVDFIAAEIKNRLHFAETISAKNKQEPIECSDQKKREETSKQTDKGTLQNTAGLTSIRFTVGWFKPATRKTIIKRKDCIFVYCE